MSWGSGAGEPSPLDPRAAPPWLKPLTDNCKDVKHAYRRRVPPEVLALVTAANTKAAITGEKRDAAVLVLFAGPTDAPSGGLPDDADLLVTVLTVRQDENEEAALLRLADLGVRLPTLQDGRRLIAAALGVPNVMPATVVLRADGSVAEVLPRSFASADEIAAAVDPKIGASG